MTSSFSYYLEVSPLRCQRGRINLPARNAAPAIALKQSLVIMVAFASFLAFSAGITSLADVTEEFPILVSRPFASAELDWFAVLLDDTRLISNAPAIEAGRGNGIDVTISLQDDLLLAIFVYLHLGPWRVGRVRITWASKGQSSRQLFRRY